MREKKVNVVEAIDALLLDAGRLSVQLQSIEDEMERRLADVRAEYAQQIERCKAELDRLDKTIKKQAKRHDAELFPTDEPESWLRLRHGTLIRTIEQRVKRARGVLEHLEELGRLEAVKVAKSVDWAVLETWPDPDLEAVGTERVVQIRYGYDVGIGGAHEQAKTAG
jgi:phage host-nuclease inhibitor protein Gam